MQAASPRVATTRTPGGAKINTVDAGSSNNTVAPGNGANSFTATSGNNTYVGGTGVDTVTVGGGGNTITTGTGNDSITFTAASANGNSYSAILNAHAGMATKKSRNTAVPASVSATAFREVPEPKLKNRTCAGCRSILVGVN